MVRQRKGRGGKKTMLKGRRGKGRYGGQRMVNVNTSLKPFAQRYITKMKYSENVLTSTLSPFYRFRLNGLNDPNLSGVGHQPHGYDQLSVLYNRYRVIACDWTIHAYPTTGSNPIRVAAQPSNDIVSPTGVADIVESPRTKWMVAVVGGSSPCLKGRTYLPSLVGRNKQQYMADDRYQSAVGADPLEQGILSIFTENLDGTGAACNLVITLNYTVEWFDVKQLAQS